MKNEKTASVSEKGQTGGVAETTPTGGSGVANATPAQPTRDVEAQLAEMRQSLTKYQSDLNALKSASQKREYELQKENEQLREEYERKMRSLMSEEALQEYDEASRARRMDELDKNYREAQKNLAEIQAANNAFMVFAQRGVPIDILTGAMSSGAEAIAGAAWNWLFNQVESKQETSPGNQPPSVSSPPPPEPPKTVTESTTAAYTGPSWDDLVKQYGSEEAVWSLVELQRLPPEIIPGYREIQDEFNS